MRLALVTAIALVAFAASATPAIAKKFKPEGHPGNGKFNVEESHGAKSSPTFSQDDDWAVRTHATGAPVAWTSLPPGIAKNYARGKPLPPGIAKKLSPQMLSQLRQHEGYEYAQVGADIVLIETATRLVVDILTNVFN